MREPQRSQSNRFFPPPPQQGDLRSESLTLLGSGEPQQDEDGDEDEDDFFEGDSPLFMSNLGAAFDGGEPSRNCGSDSWLLSFLGSGFDGSGVDEQQEDMR